MPKRCFDVIIAYLLRFVFAGVKYTPRFVQVVSLCCVLMCFSTGRFYLSVSIAQWSRDKMAAILLTKFSNTYHWMITRGNAFAGLLTEDHDAEIRHTDCSAVHWCRGEGVPLLSQQNFCEESGTPSTISSVYDAAVGITDLGVMFLCFNKQRLTTTSIIQAVSNGVRRRVT